MNTYIRDMIIILSMIVGYSIFFVEYTFAQDAAKVRSSQRSSEKPVSVKTYKPEEPVSIKAYKSIDEDFNLDLTISFTNKEKTPITNIVFLVSIFAQEGFDATKEFEKNPMFEVTKEFEKNHELEITEKCYCSAGETIHIQRKCTPSDFSFGFVELSTRSLVQTPISDEYTGYISVTKIRYSNGRVWSGYSNSVKYELEWMQ